MSREGTPGKEGEQSWWEKVRNQVFGYQFDLGEIVENHKNRLLNERKNHERFLYPEAPDYVEEIAGNLIRQVDERLKLFTDFIDKLRQELNLNDSEKISINIISAFLKKYLLTAERSRLSLKPFDSLITEVILLARKEIDFQSISKDADFDGFRQQGSGIQDYKDLDDMSKLPDPLALIATPTLYLREKIAGELMGRES